MEYKWISLAYFSKNLHFSRFKQEFQFTTRLWGMRDISATRTDFSTKICFSTRQNTAFPVLYNANSGSNALVVNHCSAPVRPAWFQFWPILKKFKKLIYWILTWLLLEPTHDGHFMDDPLETLFNSYWQFYYFPSPNIYRQTFESRWTIPGTSDASEGIFAFLKMRTKIERQIVEISPCVHLRERVG